MKNRVRAQVAQGPRHTKFQSHGGGPIKSARQPRGRDHQDRAVSNQLLNEIQNSLRSFQHQQGPQRQSKVVVKQMLGAKTHRIKYDRIKHDEQQQQQNNQQTEQKEVRRSNTPFQIASSSAFSDIDDKKFHRFSRCQSPSETRAFESPKKEGLRKTIHKYQNGQIDSSNFKSELHGQKIKINDKLNTMIRKAEAGNYVNFQAFGREIYKQVEQQDGPTSPMYARVEQPHFRQLQVNTDSDVAPIQFNYPNVPATPQPLLNGRKPNMFGKYMDNTNKLLLHNEQQVVWEEFRHIDKTYQHKRGKSKYSEINDKNKSDLPKVVLQPSEFEKKKGLEEYVSTFKTKKIDIFKNSPDSMNITNWEKSNNAQNMVDRSKSPVTSRRNETSGEFKKAYMDRVSSVCHSPRTARKNQSSQDFAII